MAEKLPFIDEHAIEVGADPETVWRALIETFGGSGNRFFETYARVIGADPVSAMGELEQAGSTRTGFRVREAIAPNRLHLTGSHRFSDYSLVWKITEKDAGRSELSARTRARFPGLHGRVYKAMVIDSGAHAKITRRMLAGAGRRATRS